MPSNSQETEPERSIKTSSPGSVSSSKRSALHKTSIQYYQKEDQQLEALEQQMDEKSVLLAQNGLRREKLLARALGQMQSISADVQVHLRSAAINFPNNAEAEPMKPSTKDLGVDPISLDITTLGIADTLPECDAGDNGLLERNLYSGDTRNERISISPSTFLSQDSVNNSHFPGTKSLTTSQLLPKLLKYSIEPHSVERGLQDFIQMDRQSLSQCFRIEFQQWMLQCSPTKFSTGSILKFQGLIELPYSHACCMKELPVLTSDTPGFIHSFFPLNFSTQHSDSVRIVFCFPKIRYR